VVIKSGAKNAGATLAKKARKRALTLGSGTAIDDLLGFGITMAV
jgi:hypothetical protein